MRLTYFLTIPFSFLSAWLIPISLAETVDIYKADDLKEAKSDKKQVEVLLHADITAKHTELDSLTGWDESHFFFASGQEYTFTSADKNTPYSLSFLGNDEENETNCGKVVANGSTAFCQLKSVTFAGWTNNWADYSIGNSYNNQYSQTESYGAALGGRDSVTISFTNNGSVTFRNIFYGFSENCHNECNVYIHGGAVYAGKTATFQGNGAINFLNVGIINHHDSNYSYHNFKGYGGAIGAQQVDLTANNSDITFESCHVWQQNATGNQGLGQGAALWVNQLLNINNNEGIVHFNQNFVAAANTSEGGAIYLVSGDKHTISGNKKNVLLTDNYVKSAPDENFRILEDSLAATGEARGGALYMGENTALAIRENTANISITGNYAAVDYSAVTANGNAEDHDDDPISAQGGALYLSKGATLSISNNGVSSIGDMPNFISISNNRVSTYGSTNDKAQGGALYLAEQAKFCLEKNHAYVNFIDNTAIHGGAFYQQSGSSAIIHANDGSVSFDKNVATYGGAFYLQEDSSASINTNKGSVSFTNNTATHGGAFYLESNSYVSMDGNLIGVQFSGNEANCGAAIYAEAGSDFRIADNDGTICFENNKVTSANELSSIARGGAIYTAGRLLINYNEGVTFSGNQAKQGSAIYAADGAQVEIAHNTGTVLFQNNKASLTGAIHLEKGAQLNIHHNIGDIAFTASDNDSYTAIYAENGTNTTLDHNGKISITKHESTNYSVIHTLGDISLSHNSGTLTLTDNASIGGNGAVFHLAGSNSTLSICHNTADIVASGNYASDSGGVIYGVAGSHIDICGNADVTITGNSSRAGGAAIDTDGALSVCNNKGAVIFGNNRVYLEASDSYILQSIRAASANISAAEGNSVEFRDAVNIQNNLNLNATYTEVETTPVSQTGDIIFTGKYTDEYDALAGGKVDTTASRSSKVQGNTQLHAGRLIVSHQAALSGQSLTTTKDSQATVLLVQGGILAQDSVHIAHGTTLQAGFSEEAATLRITELFSPAENLNELVESTNKAGYIKGGTLTLDGGSTYAMYDSILHLGGGKLILDASDAAITLTAVSAPAIISGENILLLFTGVSELQVNGNEKLFLYNQHVYGSEHLVFKKEIGAVYLRDVVPEPTTATLSLLALAALAARRRRG